MPAEKSFVYLTPEEDRGTALNVTRGWREDGYEIAVMGVDWQEAADLIVEPVIELANALVRARKRVALVGAGNEGLVAVSAGIQVADLPSIHVASVGTVFHNPTQPETPSEAFFRRQIGASQAKGEFLNSDVFVNLIDPDQIELYQKGTLDDQTLLGARRHTISPKDGMLHGATLIYNALTKQREILQGQFGLQAARRL